MLGSLRFRDMQLVLAACYIGVQGLGLLITALKEA